MTITDIIKSRYQSQGTYSVSLGYDILAQILDPKDADLAFPETISAFDYQLDGIQGSSFQTSEISMELHKYKPKTALGKKLLALRQQAIRRGLRLLSAEEIIQEVKRRRGELE